MDAAQAVADKVEAEVKALAERLDALPEDSPKRLALEKEIAKKKVALEKAQEGVDAAELVVAEAVSLDKNPESKSGNGDGSGVDDNTRDPTFVTLLFLTIYPLLATVYTSSFSIATLRSDFKSILQY